MRGEEGIIRKLQCLGGNQVSILESKRKSSVPPPPPPKKKNNKDLPKIFVIRDLDLEKIYISWARHVFLIPSLSSGHKTWYRPLLSTSLATRPSSQDSRVKMTGILVLSRRFYDLRGIWKNFDIRQLMAQMYLMLLTRKKIAPKCDVLGQLRCSR